jgi:hypothetical protein
MKASHFIFQTSDIYLHGGQNSEVNKILSQRSYHRSVTNDKDIKILQRVSCCVDFVIPQGEVLINVGKTEVSATIQNTYVCVCVFIHI